MRISSLAKSISFFFIIPTWLQKSVSGSQALQGVLSKVNHVLSAQSHIHLLFTEKPPQVFEFSHLSPNLRGAEVSSDPYSASINEQLPKKRESLDSYSLLSKNTTCKSFKTPSQFLWNCCLYKGQCHQIPIWCFTPISRDTTGWLSNRISGKSCLK